MMTTKANCQKIRSTPLEDMIFYYAPAKTNTIYTVVSRHFIFIFVKVATW